MKKTIKERWFFLIAGDKEEVQRELKEYHPEKKALKIIKGKKLDEKGYSFKNYKFRIVFNEIKPKGICAYCNKPIYDDVFAFYNCKIVHKGCYDYARGKTKYKPTSWRDFL